MSIGHKVRRHREIKGWSQEDLAIRLDVTQGTISNIESDKSIPNSLLLNKIAKELEVDINDLLNDSQNIIFSNNEFKDSSFGIQQYCHITNMQSPKLIENILKNQQNITQLIESQNRLIEKLINK